MMKSSVKVTLSATFLENRDNSHIVVDLDPATPGQLDQDLKWEALSLSLRAITSLGMKVGFIHVLAD